MYSKSVSVYGDELCVNWTGSVWVSPCDGQQHSSDRQAMRTELEAYFSACGEDVEEMADEIDGYLRKMTIKN